MQKAAAFGSPFFCAVQRLAAAGRWGAAVRAAAGAGNGAKACGVPTLRFWHGFGVWQISFTQLGARFGLAGAVRLQALVFPQVINVEYIQLSLPTGKAIC